MRDWWLDGKRLFEDITYADSMGNTFYALQDFSYIVDDGHTAILCGEAYRIENGRITRICCSGHQITL